MYSAEIILLILLAVLFFRLFSTVSKLEKSNMLLALACGRLRRRVELLETALYGSEKAQGIYDWQMNLENEKVDEETRQDPDYLRAHYDAIRRRDGEMPPDFSYCHIGDYSIEYRLNNLEKQLDIVRPEKTFFQKIEEEIENGRGVVS